MGTRNQNPAGGSEGPAEGSLLTLFELLAENETFCKALVLRRPESEPELLQRAARIHRKIADGDAWGAQEQAAADTLDAEPDDGYCWMAYGAFVPGLALQEDMATTHPEALDSVIGRFVTPQHALCLASTCRQLRRHVGGFFQLAVDTRSAWRARVASYGPTLAGSASLLSTDRQLPWWSRLLFIVGAYAQITHDYQAISRVAMVCGDTAMRVALMDSLELQVRGARKFSPQALHASARNPLVPYLNLIPMFRQNTPAWQLLVLTAIRNLRSARHSPELALACIRFFLSALKQIQRKYFLSGPDNVDRFYWLPAAVRAVADALHWHAQKDTTIPPRQGTDEHRYHDLMFEAISFLQQVGAGPGGIYARIDPVLAVSTALTRSMIMRTGEVPDAGEAELVRALGQMEATFWNEWAHVGLETEVYRGETDTVVRRTHTHTHTHTYIHTHTRTHMHSGVRAHAQTLTHWRTRR